jgi:uncharacterized protein
LAATVLLWILAIILIVIGIAGLVVPALPGPVLLFMGLLAAAGAEDFAHVGAPTLVTLGGLAVLAYVVDFVAGAFGARVYGASGMAMIGAALGAVAGLFLGLVGVLVGPFVGAVIGELMARKGLHAASRAGVGATLGFVIGAAAKLALGFAMIGVFVFVRVF